VVLHCADLARHGAGSRLDGGGGPGLRLGSGCETKLRALVSRADLAVGGSLPEVSRSQDGPHCGGRPASAFDDRRDAVAELAAVWKIDGIRHALPVHGAGATRGIVQLEVHSAESGSLCLEPTRTGPAFPVRNDHGDGSVRGFQRTPRRVWSRWVAGF